MITHRINWVCDEISGYSYGSRLASPLVCCPSRFNWRPIKFYR